MHVRFGFMLNVEAEAEVDFVEKNNIQNQRDEKELEE